jgi:hypothetical protein
VGRLFLSGLALALALAVSPPLTADAATIERVLAVVEDELILMSDVQIEAALQPLDASPSALWARHPHDPQRRALESAMLRTLAGDVGLYHPGEEDISARVAAIREATGSAEAYATLLAGLGLDESDLRAAVRRRMIAEAYARRNVAARAEDDPERWRARCDELVAGVEARLRIRRIEGAPP